MAKQARDRVQIIDTQPTAHAVGGSAVANDMMLRSIIITVALVGTVTIAGFRRISDAAAASIVLPIGLPAGAYEFGGLVNDAAAMTISLSSATDLNRVIAVSQAVSGMS